MQIIVEGLSDEGMARRVLAHCGHLETTVTILNGKSKLDAKIAKYARAARDEPWVIFRDSDNECPVDLRARLLAGVPANPLFCLRIAHTMTEAWLMGDQQGFARYFRVSVDAVPAAPETAAHAKQTLLALCRKSRARRIRDEVALDAAHAAPQFTFHLNEFARTEWDVAAAAESCPSLARAVRAIRALAKPRPASHSR